MLGQQVTLYIEYAGVGVRLCCKEEKLVNMEIAFAYSGTCTLIEGPGGNSSAYFIRIFFAGFPHLVILFCYVMIIRKVKESRREALLRSSARSRSREPASEDSLTTRQINYFKNLLSKKYKEEQKEVSMEGKNGSTL